VSKTDAIYVRYCLQAAFDAAPPSTADFVRMLRLNGFRGVWSAADKPCALSPMASWICIRPSKPLSLAHFSDDCTSVTVWRVRPKVRLVDRGSPLLTLPIPAQIGAAVRLWRRRELPFLEYGGAPSAEDL
jgi:hypothetical protein